VGSATNKFDDEGNEKVQCRICSKWFHRVEYHVSKSHGMDGAQYRAQYPGAPLNSAFALSLSPVETHNKKKKEGVFEYGEALLDIRKELSAEAAELVPVSDPDWIMTPSDQDDFEALAVAMQDNENVMIVGPAGIGKTSMVLELAARCSAPVLHMNGWGEMRSAHLQGTKALYVDEKTGQSVTDWEDSEFIKAAEEGWWVLVDEIDSLQPNITFILHPVLERRRRMFVQGRKNPHVKFDKRFRFIGTANTLGFGDESGMYTGTQVMNQALIDRFDTVIRKEYPGKDTEKAILVNLGISTSVADKMLEVVTGVRAAAGNHSIITNISTRRLVNWAKKAKRLKDVVKGAEFSLLAKVPKSDEVTYAGLIQRHFGSKTSV
jgi:cobaltochelatase CobS